MSIGIRISAIPQMAANQIQSDVRRRCYEGAYMLENAAHDILAGPRSGRTYKRPDGGHYTASAPGEPPASRTGNLRRNWHIIDDGSNTVMAIESGVKYAQFLEDGTPGGKIAPRPYVERIKNAALPDIQQIFGQAFHFSISRV